MKIAINLDILKSYDYSVLRKLKELKESGHTLSKGFMGLTNGAKVELVK